ncbi:MAG: hypothetical protein CO002_01800 [Candidatus Portnoybacteria bacterium CG_4_8_14_3_um_filter_44_10]|uniref:Type 4a pilus biogenesis protein PilO n=5 Tax=Candidatus Portnoyibacteriota TaxID=1817913 RepID=A0A2H0KQH3_9BACT|nr:MAG: hypothetical protein AUK17_02975 [Parcubacteria group bacterium CG2_30_44_18]PIQ74400.1 MAG: hypothetical protein COV85_02305 [Candidatus Portnoybacteria bacterium CG11_big_fil_rev_8_21_14_0_20_44_10]PIS17115.1 MAG: hypothetical protein COT61_00235 [Candidatus Portnoybacteria bacterium CG09_land_8_20_14_0_10_44_13]PIW75479.1 MAG: hypothetical protein CO002_01800 [Candidatus Portnoybacteria bacterium CG_4_8_14_3_um_filter_44_10]PIZ70370.1 MAG: hypothetical protein COY11_02745 [Candidatus
MNFLREKMTMPLLSEKKRVYLILGGVIIVCLLASFFVTYFFLMKIQAASRDLSEKKAEIASLQKKKQSFSDSEREYQEIQPELVNVNQSFLKKGDFLPFILTLEKIAQRSGNNYENKLISESSKDEVAPGWTTADFQITLKGDFPSLLKFLMYLENAPYAIEMSDLRIQGGGWGATAGKEQQEITTVFGLRAFVGR